MLDGNSEKKPWIATLPWKEQFSRFMLLKPNTRNDEKLFLAIVEFLSKLSESPEFEPVIKDLINEGNRFSRLTKLGKYNYSKVFARDPTRDD